MRDPALPDQLDISLAASRGEHKPQDAVEAPAVGADAILCISAFLWRSGQLAAFERIHYIRATTSYTNDLH